MSDWLGSRTQESPHEPNLGVVELSDFRSLVVADIPGIIEGAHVGKGLGHQFLRHIERTRVLLLMVPVDSEDPQSELTRLREELAAYSTELSGTPFCVGLSKVDVLTPGASLPEVTADEALRFIRFSSVTREGLEELLEGLWEASHAAKKSGADDNEEEWWSP